MKHLSDERIDNLLDELDTIARDHESYEYGLPVMRSDDEEAPIHKLRAAVRAFIARECLAALSNSGAAGKGITRLSSEGESGGGAIE